MRQRIKLKFYAAFLYHFRQRPRIIKKLAFNNGKSIQPLLRQRITNSLAKIRKNFIVPNEGLRRRCLQYDMQTESIQPINTDRLILHCLSVEFLRNLSEGGIASARRLVDYSVPVDCSLLGHRQIDRRLKMIDADPSQHPWMYRAIVRKDDKQMIGFISFHHKAPDPDLSEYADLGAELGYTIEQEYRRKGYAKKSAIGMMGWANREFGVRDFVLTISPENHPSLKMAESMNFENVGEWDDPIDGLEFVMKAKIDQILKTKKAYQDASSNSASRRA